VIGHWLREGNLSMRRVFFILGSIAVTSGAVLSCWINLRPDPIVYRNTTTVPAAPREPQLTLDAAKQKYIWDLEHVTFELETKFATHVTAALRNRNRDGLLAIFCDDASGAIRDRDKSVVVQRGPLRERRLRQTDADLRPADVGELAEYLIAAFGEFAEFDAIGLRVLRIDAKDRDPASGEWQLTIYLNARGRGEASDMIELESTQAVACRFLTDAEIEAGRIVTRWEVESESVRRSSAAMLEEVTAQVGLDRVELHDNWTKPRDLLPVQFGVQIAAEDFDRDGYLDIAVSSFDDRHYLLRSVRGERFEDVLRQVGIQPKRDRGNHLAAWIDYDNDGYPDLLLGDSLYHNERGTRFENVTPQSGLEFGIDPMGAVVADYDCDGWLDLYVLYQVSSAPVSGRQGFVGDDQTGAENQLWRNEGGGRFRNVTAAAAAGAGKRHTFAAAWFHANGDRYPDLYVANDFGANVLLLNEGGARFRDVSSVARVGDYSTSMGVATGDIDNDGSPEIYVANMYSKAGRRIVSHVSTDDYPSDTYEQIVGSCAGSRLYKKLQDHDVYDELSEPLGVNAVGWAFGPALVDLDGDGFLDIYSTTGFLSFRRDRPDG
jgi:hypothetical protein